MKRFIGLYGLLAVILLTAPGKAGMARDILDGGSGEILAPRSTDTIVPLGLNLEGFEYPYPVHYITLSIQKQVLKMAYMDVRPTQSNGHSILLLHGKSFCGDYWGSTAQLLSGKGYRVIIPDQIGFGKSSKPEHLQYTFQLLARNTKALLDSLGVDKIIVLGHSMGGMVATRFTLLFPGFVERLVLEDPIGLEDWKLKVPDPGVDGWFKSGLKQNYASLKKYQLDNYYHGVWSPAYDRMLNMQAGWTLNPGYERIAWNSALTSDMIFTQPVLYEFGLIQPRTLLIIGDLDRTALGKNLVTDSVATTMGNYPVLGKQTRMKIPHCELIVLPGVGHVPHMEAFDAFAKAVLGWLQQ